jgi:hypothetical protein
MSVHGVNVFSTDLTGPNRAVRHGEQAIASLACSSRVQPNRFLRSASLSRTAAGFSLSAGLGH